MRILYWVFLSIVSAVTLSWSLPVPTTIQDVFLPGSQPNQSGTLENPSRCDNCHGGYGEQAVEPAFNWRGSMMAQAARDPLYFASVAIANQDAPQSGDLCIRCHSPKGWLEGRSTPTDGSALTANDRESVQCDFCHKLVKPRALEVNPYPSNAAYTSGTYPRDQTYLATLNPIPPTSGDGMYIADSDNGKRGPFSDAVARHTFYTSPFHPEAALCGTCHDVSNPVFSRDSTTGQYLPNAFGAAAPNFDPRQLFPIERTYSEWTVSAYNSPQGVYAPQFGGNRDSVATCQDCHMRDVTGHGCGMNDAPLRTNLPLHDMTGGNTVVPRWAALQYPAEVFPAALDSGIARARYMLQHAATLALATLPANEGHLLRVRVTNETGHKLPSGYPEGRRIWLRVRAYDEDNLLIYESGAYDTATAVLTHDPAAKIYEIEPGVSPAIAAAVGVPAGPSYHFVINNTIYKDNRIPPRGFTNAAFTQIQSPPVGYSFADGQYWDDTDYLLPEAAVSAQVALFYQSISKEFIEFLRDANTSNTAGTTAYNLWASTGKSPPETMAADALALPIRVHALVIQTDGETVVLTWPTVPLATSYRIYRSDNVQLPAADWALVATRTDTTFSEPLPTDGNRNFYLVTAVR